MKKYVLTCLIFMLFVWSSSGYAYPERFDVIIDVGHGGIDGGTVSPNNMLEKDLNLEIGKKLYQKLMDQGYNVGITRLRDYALSDDSRLGIRSRHLRDLTQRKLIADALKPKLFISIHMNAAAKESRRGPLVIYQASEKSYAVAQLLQQHLNEVYKMKKWPLKGKSYFLMKHLEMPSVIVEVGYMSNPRDLAMLTDEAMQTQLVDAMAHSIGEYFLVYPVD
ncbi:N-acetylmuramoyl-L-alanine amidase [Ammoniphilus sp. YIM 78166]|uniref:N-acetylmuramoyl-L-alanine amidase family protein n=1 Tax=Ammoniphilus sp. YIM 78166 TaxID=1644106 RepID=UPI001430D5CB|nr:N-acetylmuramoyl-L-alanine amidase [Ammoniphilus sp. YIM 78166]